MQTPRDDIPIFPNALLVRAPIICATTAVLLLAFAGLTIPALAEVRIEDSSPARNEKASPKTLDPIAAPKLLPPLVNVDLPESLPVPQNNPASPNGNSENNPGATQK